MIFIYIIDVHIPQNINDICFQHKEKPQISPRLFCYVFGVALASFLGMN